MSIAVAASNIQAARTPRGRLGRTAFAALTVLALILPSAGLAREGDPPNILFVFADDLGWRDVGYHGSDFHETPNLDRLARESMVFTQGYAGAGNCAPSRACVLSGQYSPRHEVYAVGTTDRGPKEKMRLVPVPNQRSLAAANVTVAGALKAAGYVTGIFGKWHLENGPRTRPGDQGFDVVHESQHAWRSTEPESDNPKGVYSLTRGAIDFMRANRDRPFFAHLSHYAPHSAYQARPTTLAKFKAKPPGRQHNHPLYAACVYDLDDSVGILLRALAELELEKNTLVVFTSDNGSNMSCEPLRGKKGSYYEGGIRVPFIVRWPGVTPSGSRCDVPVVNQDLYPTFLAVAGAAPPADKVLDGESLVPLLRQTGGLKREAIFWHFPGYLDGPVPRGRDAVFRTRPVTTMNKGGLKLHLFHEEWLLDGGRDHLPGNRSVELYDLHRDPGETHNLATSEPARRDALLGDLLRWLDATSARLPAQKDPVPTAAVTSTRG